MAPGKMWIVSPIQYMSERKMDWLIRCTKHYIFSGKAPFTYVHHYQLQHQRFTQNKIKIPLSINRIEGGPTETTYIEITILLDVTNVGPASLSRSTYWQQSYILKWRYIRAAPQNREIDMVHYETFLDPEVTMQIIHTHYFSCFQQRDIQRAIRGEQLLRKCEHIKTHYPKVGTPLSLEKLAFFAYIKHTNGASASKSPSLMAKSSNANNYGSGASRPVGTKRRGRKTLLQRQAPWNLG
ncbi:vif protein [Simian immunodeficiency virus]|uniref:Virion infectivity factor n=1 Tax=Simian immunodeficiency virus TaxID=11723 RepID=A4UDF5_SIV|nr:vif protein [Simian immunodeficiency virus]